MLRSVLLQTLFFIFIFNAVAMLRETSMLASDDTVSPMHHELTTIDQKSIQIKAEGKKTIVYFFAPWCKVCHMSIGNLEAIYKNMPDVDVIAIALDFVDEAQVKEFTDNHQLSFPIAYGNEAVKADFKVKGYPSYYVLNEQNMIVSRSLGYSSEIGLYFRSL